MRNAVSKHCVNSDRRDDTEWLARERARGSHPIALPLAGGRKKRTMIRSRHAGHAGTPSEKEHDRCRAAVVEPLARQRSGISFQEAALHRRLWCRRCLSRIATRGRSRWRTDHSLTENSVVWAILNSDQNEALKEIIEGQKSDRIVAVVGAAILEDSLRSALVDRMRAKDGKTDINEKLFRVGGPLGNFAPKIDLGYQLWMFEKPYRNAMYGISEIRNMFAHNLGNTSFSSKDEKMVGAFKKLELHEGNTHYPIPWADNEHLIEPINSNRDVFFVNLKLCLIWLMSDTSKHQAYTNIPSNYIPCTSEN